MANPTSDRSERDLLYELIREQYGEQLTGEQLEDVRRMIDTAVANAERLRAVRLGNADEPPTTFTPYRKEG